VSEFDIASVDDVELRAWLREELGLNEYRRVVRENATTLVISKFEAGFSQDLFATVDLLPELFDDAVILAEYGRLVAEHRSRGQSPMRTEVWREAGEAVLNRLSDERGIDQQRRMYVLPGIESVQAVMDAILWSAPTIDDQRAPDPGEVQAYADFCSPEMERDIFTRFYGVLEDRRIENYCPGAQFARRLVDQAWRVCAGDHEYGLT
jgi:hypothetical protein